MGNINGITNPAMAIAMAKGMVTAMARGMGTAMAMATGPAMVMAASTWTSTATATRAH